MMSAQPNRARTLRELVIDHIQEALAQGRLRPGDSLDQVQIAATLDVSRTPVREALVLLEAQGIVESDLRRGTVIRTLSPEDIEDDHLVLAALEHLVAGLAVPRLTTQDLARMNGLLAQSEILLENGMMAELHQVNREFHRTIYQACTRPRLIQFLEGNLWIHTHHYNRIFIDLKGAPSWRLDIHRRILQACEAGDVTRAQALIFEDDMETGRRVSTFLRERNAHTVERSQP